MAAGATSSGRARSFYFVGEETRREFEKQKGVGRREPGRFSRGNTDHAGQSDLDATCVKHHPHAFDGRRAGGQLRAPGGAPMALAPVANCLCSTFLRYRTRRTRSGPTRDRFVLSAGHASMLLYSLLHLTGVKAVSKSTALGESSVPLDAI